MIVTVRIVTNEAASFKVLDAQITSLTVNYYEAVFAGYIQVLEHLTKTFYQRLKDHLSKIQHFQNPSRLMSLGFPHSPPDTRSL